MLREFFFYNGGIILQYLHLFSSVSQKLCWHNSGAHLNTSFSLRIVMTHTCTTNKGKGFPLRSYIFRAVNEGTGLHVNTQGTNSFAGCAIWPEKLRRRTPILPLSHNIWSAQFKGPTGPNVITYKVRPVSIIRFCIYRLFY